MRPSVNTLKKTGIIAGCIALALPVAILSGCASTSGSGSIGGLELPNISLGSQHVKASDRDAWSQLQDIDGNTFATVIRVTPVNDNNFDVKTFQQALNDNSIAWYQMIAGENMGTSRQELGYLYFPLSTTLPELQSAAELITASGWTAEILTPEQYQEYVDAVNPNDLYYNETTYFGPAAASDS